MRVSGLDGREYTLSLRGREVFGGDTRQRSSPHLAARRLLRRVFPLAPLLEEVSLPGTGGLTADFLLPHERAVVEVHGQQHFKFNAYFHKTRAGFLASLRRDRMKADWCSLNGFRLVILPDTEDEVAWQRRISGGETGGDGAGPGGDPGPEGPDPDREAGD